MIDTRAASLALLISLNISPSHLHARPKHSHPKTRVIFHAQITRMLPSLLKLHLQRAGLFDCSVTVTVPVRCTGV